MAPRQGICRDDNVPLAAVDELIQTKEAAAAGSIDCNDGCSGSVDSSAKEDELAPPRPRKMTNFKIESKMPESILRPAKYTTNDDNNNQWPQLQTIDRHSVHFPTTTSMVTDVRTRPRTHVLDIPTLYYSPEDTRRFKREYRQLLRSQTVARKRMEWRSRQKINGGDTSTATDSRSNSHQPQQHDNSFWRSKVGRRWSSSSSAAASCENKNGPAVVVSEEIDVVESLDPLNDGSAGSLISASSYDADDSDESEDEIPELVSSSSGIFSSVFDVAREAVSILNGPSSRYYYQDQHSHRTSELAASSRHVRKPCNTSLHLVDTLYLF